MFIKYSPTICNGSDCVNGQWFWKILNGHVVALTLSHISAVNGNIQAYPYRWCMGSKQMKWTNILACGDNTTFHAICEFFHRGLSPVGNTVGFL